jgi:hypothetical protein
MMDDLPDKPLKVGDSYGFKHDISFSGIPFAVNIRYKFLGLKTVEGQRCAEFTFTISGSGSVPAQGAPAPFTIQGNGTMLISVADGLTTHSGGDLYILVNQAGTQMKLKVTTTIQRK